MTSKPSLENLVESGVIEVESLHPGGMITTHELAELCHVDKNTKLLDVASGTGESACYLAEEFKSSIIGIDASEIMVARAKEKTIQRKLTIDFSVGDAHNLPFDDHSFDVVISECTTCVLDKQRAITEMVRVVKTGGYVGIHDICWRNDTPEKMKTKLAEIESERPETLEGWVHLFQQAGLENCNGIDRSELIPAWMRESKKNLGVKGQWKIVQTVFNSWGLKGLWTVFQSERIFASRHTGYGIIVGQKPIV